MTIFSIWTEITFFRLPFRFSSVFLPGPVFCTLPPFTLPFLFRFSSGAASLEELLFGLPFTLPFLFRFSSGTMCFSRMWILGALWYQVWLLIAEVWWLCLGVLNGFHIYKTLRLASLRLKVFVHIPEGCAQDLLQLTSGRSMHDHPYACMTVRCGCHMCMYLQHRHCEYTHEA